MSLVNEAILLVLEVQRLVTTIGFKLDSQAC